MKKSMKIVTRSEAEKFTSPYIGKTVSRVWSGAGSSVFLEVGDLFESKGELTITMEWSWRVENTSNILYGTFSERAVFEKGLKELHGLSLEDISFHSRLPEVVVKLSNNIWVSSFSTVEGDPEWALITNTKTLHSKNGELCFE